ncbi:MAG: DUF6526 family protein [Ginsengibacter sp.]
MQKQDYHNHPKYYIPHHFIFLPIMGICIGYGVKNILGKNDRLEWILFTILSACILYLVVMLRQHYALGNQDRIIRLEFRLRYFELFGKSSTTVEDQLSFAQIAALRFAYDDEFKLLLEKALQENLKADEIKRSIKNWKADHMRV